MKISRIPKATSYPGMVSLEVNGKTYKAVGDWTDQEMVEAVRKYHGVKLDNPAH